MDKVLQSNYLNVNKDNLERLISESDDLLTEEIIKESQKVDEDIVAIMNKNLSIYREK